MLQERSFWVTTALLAAAAVGGATAYRHHHRYKHFAVHDPGMMYRSAWLEPDVFEELIEKHQFRAVLNLCNSGEMGLQRWESERTAISRSGARLLEIPMPTTVDPADPRIARHIAVLANMDNYPMLVHCQHGVTRTAKLLAIYDILFRGLSADESLAAMPLFGRDDHNVHVRAFARNFEMVHDQFYPSPSAADLSVLRP